MLTKFAINQLQLTLPIFCPDATRGVIKSLSPNDLTTLNLPGVIVNTWHLAQNPGINFFRAFGGIKKLMNYAGLVISDSGGFQVYSLFQKQPGFGKITDAGLVTYTDHKQQHKMIFTPEDSIKMQFALKSDLMICLDDFSPPTGTPERWRESVTRTIAWARRCQQEFKRQLQKHPDPNYQPQLFAVIQGHRDLKLRKECAQALLELGFAGFGLGGFPYLPSGKLDLALTAANAQLTPNEFPRYALGFGKPNDIVALYRQGYTIFDCVLPTRDARHGRLYLTPPTGQQYDWQAPRDWLHLKKSQYQLDSNPPDPHCLCTTCQTTSRAYLHHLLKTKDTAFYRLATIHNLHFYTNLMQSLRNQ
jgi:queuine tRNA-ribosyltransferase